MLKCQLAFLLLFLCLTVVGQQNFPFEEENCTYEPISEKLEKKYYNSFKNKNQNGKSISSSIITIPIVVHIFHDGDTIGTKENPSNEFVTTIIEELNQHFHHTHSNAQTYSNPLYGADVDIEFCLTHVSPDSTYTSGVIRHFDANAALGHGFLDNKWDTNKYLNIYLIRFWEDYLSRAGRSYGSQGVAFSRGGLNALLMAHEIGHYLGLSHLFSGNCNNSDCLNDGDKICDTPPKNISGGNGASSCTSPNNSCDTDEDDTSNNNPYRATSLGGMGDQLDMLANYMDYTGGCWDAFTEGQKDRMRWMTENSSYISSVVQNGINCSTFPLNSVDINILKLEPVLDNPCDDIITVNVKLKNDGASTIENFQLLLELNGDTIYNEYQDIVINHEEEIILSIPNVSILCFGEQNFQCHVQNPNDQIDSNLYNNSLKAETKFFSGSNNCDNYLEIIDFSNTAWYTPADTISGSIELTNSYNIEEGTNAILCVKLQGDIDGNREIYQCFDEDKLRFGYTYNGEECGNFSRSICYEISSSKFVDWSSDNSIEFHFVPLRSQDAIGCSSDNDFYVDLSIPILESDITVENYTYNENKILRSSNSIHLFDVQVSSPYFLKCFAPEVTCTPDFGNDLGADIFISNEVCEN